MRARRRVRVADSNRGRDGRIIYDAEISLFQQVTSSARRGLAGNRRVSAGAVRGVVGRHGRMSGGPASILAFSLIQGSQTAAEVVERVECQGGEELLAAISLRG